MSAFLFLLSASTMGQQAVAPGASSLEAEAEEGIRRYSVELIIFEYTDSSSAGTEIFDPDEAPAQEADSYSSDSPPEEPPEFDPTMLEKPRPAASPESDDRFFADDTRDLTPVFIDEPLAVIPTYEQAGLRLLGPEDYVLNDVYERLERLDAYRPLMRTAWIQQTPEKDVAAPIKLRRLGDPPLRLDGTITLYLSRYLHLVVDLALEEKAPLRMPAANNRLRRFGDERSRFNFDPDFITPSTFYRIEEDRIVRNGELRYYDHPRFGVLARITRVEENDSGEDAADTVATPIGGAN